MATLYISEFTNLSLLGSSQAQAAAVPPGAEQTLAIGGGSIASAAFGPLTKLVRVHADAACSIAWGPAPVATTANMRLAAGQTEYFGAPPGGKLAVIANT